MNNSKPLMIIIRVRRIRATGATPRLLTTKMFKKELKIDISKWPDVTLAKSLSPKERALTK